MFTVSRARGSNHGLSEDTMQKRLEGLLRDTWWLWLAFIVIAVVMTILVSKVFLVTFPILVVSFFYYAGIRYDDTGNHKEDGPA